MGKNKNLKLFFAWLVVLIITIIMTLFFQNESTSFYGIAETKEMKINSKITAEILKIHVKEGELIKKGTLLVSLSSPELTLKIKQIDHQIKQLQAEKGINKQEIKANIEQLEAQKTAVISEIDYKIKQLENKYEINKHLSEGLKSLETENSNNSNKSSILLKITALKEEQKLAVSPLDIKIDLLRKELKEADMPVEIVEQKLREELKMLQQENQKLNIYSSIFGIVGEVNFKDGEKVAPFVPIMTVHSRKPSFVKGYIHENFYTKMGISDKVKVVSVADRKSLVKGAVMGVGTKIVEYPIRLRKHPDIALWGREIIIEIPDSNNFILGEKVLISLVKRGKFLAEIANPIEDESRDKQVANQENLKKEYLPKGLEASEIIYLADLNKYLILDDDTKKKKPIIYLYNASSQEVEAKLISGLKKINDLEAATIVNDSTLLLASSQSYNKKGKLGKSRKLLVQVKRKNDDFSLEKKIKLYDLLVDYAGQGDLEVHQFLRSGIENKTLDIEGIAFKDGNLYLGFKDPLLNEAAIILELKNIDLVLETKEIPENSLTIWKKLKLTNRDKIYHLSGICFSGNDLLVTGVFKKNSCLWKVDSKPKLLVFFEGLKAEGVSITPKDKEYAIVFDQGKHRSQIAFIKEKK